VSKRFVAGEPACTQPPVLLLCTIESRRDDHPLRPRSVAVTFLLGATRLETRSNKERQFLVNATEI
jgi:hypothetical protein